MTRTRDRAAQLQRHELRAVAEAQDRDAQLVDGAVDGGRRRLVDRLGAAAEDDGLGRAATDLLYGDGGRNDFGVDVCLADPAGDEPRVLGPEVDDEDGVGQCPIPTPCERCSALPSVCSAGAIITSAFWNSFTVS